MVTITQVTLLLLLAPRATSHVVFSFIAILLLPDKVLFIYHPVSVP